MPALKPLDRLLKEMTPTLISGEYVFISISKESYSNLKINPLMIFHEREGVTLILNKIDADQNNLKYIEVWKLITLNVQTELTAVGFLATITDKLSKKGIRVNAVSAFYHDHLFVPVDKAHKAMTALIELTIP